MSQKLYKLLQQYLIHNNHGSGAHVTRVKQDSSKWSEMGILFK